MTFEQTSSFHTNELRERMKTDALAQLSFFKRSLSSHGGFACLSREGNVRVGESQELITTTRLIHSYALGKLAGVEGCDDIIDAGMKALWENHRDKVNGGYIWSFTSDGLVETDKLAYGHMFVLLAASSAKSVGHPDADRLLDDVSEVITDRFWDENAGLMHDEFRRDWSCFSDYRGMNANMHGVEAHLSAFEVTGSQIYLDRAQRILSFFVDKIAASRDWRLAEHYTSDWKVDAAYEGNPMFRPKGTTPGHSFELGRLLIQAWDLGGRKDDAAVAKARALIETALKDAWRPNGGFAYTLDFDGKIDVSDRYWWPVTEAIGAVATLLKLGGTQADQIWYDKLWDFAFECFVDSEHGGWIPEIGDDNLPCEKQFTGKPDIYHALQADLFPLHNGVSRHYEGIKDILKL